MEKSHWRKKSNSEAQHTFTALLWSSAVHIQVPPLLTELKLCGLKPWGCRGWTCCSLPSSAACIMGPLTRPVDRLRRFPQQHDAPAGFYPRLSEELHTSLLSSCCLPLQQPCFIILHVLIYYIYINLYIYVHYFCFIESVIYLSYFQTYCNYTLLDVRKQKWKIDLETTESKALLVIISPEQLLHLWWTCCILINMRQHLFRLFVLLEPEHERLLSMHMKHSPVYRQFSTDADKPHLWECFWK